jgi:hypothetical protein
MVFVALYALNGFLFPTLPAQPPSQTLPLKGELNIKIKTETYRLT